MNAKWFLSTLLVSLVFFGFVVRQQPKQPNQELIVHLSEEVSPSTVKKAQNLVTNQLEQLGVENIQVHESQEGLIITYFSSTDVNSIKSLLSKGNEFEVNSKSSQQHQEEENHPYVQFDIYEIQRVFDFDANSDGFVLEPKSESDRFFNPDFETSLCGLQNNHKEYKDEQARIAGQEFFIIPNTLYNIPEVRAGPIV